MADAARLQCNSPPRCLTLRQAGHEPTLVAHLKSFEERYPGMQHINLSPPLTTPKDKMVEQYRMVGELVMPHFRSRPAVQAAAK
jgi:hypothetical protein